MPKVGMPEIRKPQLIKAAIEAIDELGFAGATVSVIGKKAGVSPAIINHYFGGKNGLLEETMKSLIREFFEILDTQLTAERSSSCKQQVNAIVNTCFSQSQTTAQAMKAWIGFWASAMHTENLARLQKVYARRLNSILVVTLRQSFSIEESRHIAATLAALIDGMWLRSCLAGDEKHSSESLIGEYLDIVFRTKD
ncbi:transcriptional regulator BetI [Marinomonas sp. 42_23_T18]|nr:transcriptional regulator BetI [Marinomonas sp. 42_23_T18]